MRLFALPLGTRLTLLALLTLCPLAVLILVSHFEDRDAKREIGRTAVTTFAQTAANSVEAAARDIDSYTAAGALVIGSNPQPIDNAAYQPYLRSLFTDLTTRNASLSALFITDVGGRVIAQNAGSDTGFDLSDRPYIKAMQAGAVSFWSGGFPGTRSGQIIATFARVIHDPEGVTRGYLVLAFNPAGSGARPDIPSDADIFLADQYGKLIYSSNDPTLQSLPETIGDYPAVQTALQGNLATIKDEATPIDSGRRYGAVVPIPHTGWVVGYTRSQAVLDAEVTRRLYRDLGVLAFVVVLTLAALYFVAWRMTRPLSRLAEAATAIAAGRPVDIPPADADPDLAKLQSAFARMLASVAERENALSDQTRLLSTLEQVGANIASDLDFASTVKAVAEAGTRLTEAQLGLFFYRLPGDDEIASYRVTSLAAGAAPFEGIAVVPDASLFTSTYWYQGVIRLDSATDATNGGFDFVRRRTTRDLPSVLALPIRGSGDEVLGVLFFGHQRPRAFNDRHEALAVGIASWAGIALDNARLYEEAQAIQQELRESNKAKDEFLGLVSHELRTPTSTIYGGIRLLETRSAALSPAAMTELIKSVSEEASRLVRLIENLLAFARLELGREIERRPGSVNELVKRVVEPFERAHRDRSIAVEYGDDLPDVQVEPSYFELILQNLLSNADKYSPPGRPIEVETRLAGDEVQVLVSDHGEGVSPEETARIFESFYRSKDASSVASGHGLGLTVCKRLVDAQSGHIWARNLPRGGLQVAFSLPVVRHDVVPEPQLDGVTLA